MVYRSNVWSEEDNHQAAPHISENRGRSDAKHGGSSETKFKKPSGGGPFRQAHAIKCWSLGKVPNCKVPECGAAHHFLLHDAIAKPRAMLVKRMDDESPNVLLCREEAGVRHGREMIQMNVLYDWGATASVITHQAAARASPTPMPRKEQEVSGLNGAKSRSGCTYEIPMMDHLGQVKLIHAAGVDKIAWL